MTNGLGMAEDEEPNLTFEMIIPSKAPADHSNVTVLERNASTPLPPGYEPLVVPLYTQTIIITMYSLIVILAFGGNLIICYTVMRASRMRTVINLFIVSLAISDLLMALFCIPLTFVANLILNYWPFGDFLCPAWSYLQVVVVFLSSFTLIAISMDRYVAIIFPLRQKLTKSKALFIICIVWFLALAVPTPTAYYARTHRYVDYPTAPTFCEEIWDDDQSKRIYSTAILILQYMLPLVVMAITYGQIILVMWINKPPGEAVSSRDQRMAESKKKITKMMFTVVLIYALCWLPLHALNLAGDINPSIYDGEHMNILWMVSHWLAMSNCMYNPFVYCWMNSKFRQGFVSAFRCLTCGLVKFRRDRDSMRMQRQNTYMTSVTNTSCRKRYLVKDNCIDSAEGSPLTGHRNGRMSSRT
ncbi:RYamide receptor-like [Haliotis cracherodii]|uniref:RYamide receptor-like n=1 Tax=Haliotis rufescens TaxID=6454 RepID=UPI001EB009E3|nr:RYamide receptor-like [Haliotis rufescens]